MQPGVTHVTVRNGLSLAYVVALVNASLALVIAFGANLDSGQQAAIVGFVNAAVLLAARVLHLPERTLGGGAVAIRHVPVLETTPAPTHVVPVAVVEPLVTEEGVPNHG